MWLFCTVLGVSAELCFIAGSSDSEAELALVSKLALEAGADAAVPSAHWALGGKGAVDLAQAVIDACKEPNDFKLLYGDELSIKDKIETIAREMYGAGGVEYTEEAERQIESYTKQGFGRLPICMAKTQYSFSADPNAKGAPSGLFCTASHGSSEFSRTAATGFVLPIRELKVAAGAGFIYPLVGVRLFVSRHGEA
jgi:methylenetetrahydrofolate dehydrogenase (NADP+)/methenyltetrahydrofolate cyclohydrolase/formyltetrahydrofolate synthetase